jgi:hypothetical protein
MQKLGRIPLKYLMVLILVFNIFIITAIICAQLYIINGCINDPNVHEWLHHIALCILGIPNIQTPISTLYPSIYLVLPDWRLAFPGIPYYTNTPLNELTLIPLNIPNLAWDFPYLAAKIGVSLIPMPLLIFGVLLMKKGYTDFGFMLILMFIIYLPATFSLIQDIHRYNIIEWINNIMQFYYLGR